MSSQYNWQLEPCQFGLQRSFTFKVPLDTYKHLSTLYTTTSIRWQTIAIGPTHPRQIQRPSELHVPRLLQVQLDPDISIHTHPHDKTNHTTLIRTVVLTLTVQNTNDFVPHRTRRITRFAKITRFTNTLYNTPIDSHWPFSPQKVRKGQDLPKRLVNQSCSHLHEPSPWYVPWPLQALHTPLAALISETLTDNKYRLQNNTEHLHQ